MFYLMIKTHTETRLKYLCITKRKNYSKYLGSGTAWRRHLKKFGSNITTEVLFESDDYSSFQKQCAYFSNLHDVVNSTEWANAIPEIGYDSGLHGKCNFEIWWALVSDDVRRETIKKRNKSISDGHWVKTENAVNIKNKIAEKQQAAWVALDECDKRSRVQKMRDGLPEEVSEETRHNLSEALKKHNNSLTQEQRIKRSIGISKGRLSMTDESKKLRGIRYAESLKQSASRDDYETRMKSDRLGSGNPNAKAILINGEKYNSIKEACDRFGISRPVLNGRLISSNWEQWKRL